MEFLRVGESKLKIVISAEEMRERKIDFSEKEEKSNSKFRRAVWEIIDKAKAEVDFDPSGDKILVQFYPIRAGGCEIFVTKLGILPDSAAKLVSKSDKIAMLSKKESFYAFDSLDDLRVLSAVIMRSGMLSPKSDVFRAEGRYYLSIEEYGKGGESMEFPCILEFANRLTADYSIFISEHAEKLTSGEGIRDYSALEN